MSKGEVFQSQNKYEVYIGLKDKDTYNENFTAEAFRKIILNYCEENEIAFTIGLQIGGYEHNKGYVTETSIKIILCGIDEDRLIPMISELKATANTDTVMVTKEKIAVAFI